MTINVHATYRDGLIHPVHPLNLPEGTELELTVEAADPPKSPASTSNPTPARIFSPKLVHPEQIADFQMEVRAIRMPAYDATNFRPPAPVAAVTLRLSGGATVSNIPMLLDTGADVSLVPRDAFPAIASGSTTAAQYELEAFDGTRTTSPAVKLEMQFLGKSFRGQFLLIDGECGIIGRNILNNLSLRLDGPSQSWTEDP